MYIPSHDIFEIDLRPNPARIDAVEDLETARLLLDRLGSLIPGEYFAFDQRARQIVETVVGSGSDLRVVPE